MFDAMAFREAVNVFTIAQEILVDNGGYPTEKIATRSHAYRPLGLGYANLGALLMAMGLPYDSDAGRNEAAKITALMTGQAYLTSTFLAEQMGPFLFWDKNRKSALRVLLKHEGEARKFNGEIAELWSQVIARAEAAGLRNAQSTVLAPCGTISFMMDCDTTGVEPDIGLVKYKSLVGGGTLKLVNHSIAPALTALGYDSESSGRIVKYIEDNGVAEGAPGLRPEHLPIFDTSLPSGPNRRSIHYKGHIKMMAAVQPFLSGAIAKCITGDTLVFTDSGIVPIKHFYNNEAADQLTPTSVTLATETGPEQADQFYYGGVRPTIRLTLSDGRTIEGTPNHRIKVGNAEGYDWKRLDEITTNDYAAIKLGANIWSIHDADLSRLCSIPTIRMPKDYYDTNQDESRPSSVYRLLYGRR